MGHRKELFESFLQNGGIGRAQVKKMEETEKLLVDMKGQKIDHQK